MNTDANSSTVGRQCDIRVIGVPFALGTEVEVTISPKRESAVEFVVAWQRVCDEFRAQPQAATLTDNEIRKEIDDHCAGR
jgi:hypothetical protein